MKLLVVEDEPELREMMVQVLKEQAWVVETAATYAEAEEKTDLYEYDCILLDLMLPDGNGLDLLESLQQKHNPPQILITSAKAAVEDRVKGLMSGADDYLPKPFDLGELVARVNSQLRRRQGGKKSLQAGNVELFPDERRVVVDGNPLELLHKEYHILQYFITRPTRMVDKQSLAEAVWGDHADQSDNYNYVYQQVANLKRKLKEARASIEIRSVYGFGYKLVAEGSTEDTEAGSRPEGK